MIIADVNDLDEATDPGCILARDRWPDFPDGSRGTWCVLRTRSRQEKAVAAAIDANDAVGFLPLVDAERFHGNRKRVVQLPLFPGYVFFFGDLDTAYRIDRSRRLAAIIPVSDQALLHEELTCLKQAMQLGADFEPYPFLSHGTIAEVMGGPYKGVRGMVDRQSSKTRIVLQVSVLQTAMAIELDGIMLHAL